jgi:uncharacterized protein (DUF1919 family)
MISTFLQKLIYFLQDKVKKHYLKNNLNKLKGEGFSIISSNCWGGILYKDFNIKYQSPFVNMFIYTPCYIKLLENLNYYLKCELKFISASKYIEKVPDYPIGLLGDIEIHFIHYSNPIDVLRKWNERTERLNYDNLVVVMSERDQCLPDHIRRFDALPFKNKICFSVNPYNFKSVVQLKILSWSGEMLPADQIAGLTYKKLNVISYLNNVITQ